MTIAMRYIEAVNCVEAYCMGELFDIVITAVRVEDFARRWVILDATYAGYRRNYVVDVSVPAGYVVEIKNCYPMTDDEMIDFAILVRANDSF